MARVYEYKRSVDAVTTEGYHEEFEFEHEDVSTISIKEEPCDMNEEETCVLENDDDIKHISNNMPGNTYNEEKTSCYLTMKESEYIVSDNTSKNKSDDINAIICSSEKSKSRKRKRDERHSHVDTNDSKSIKALHERNDIKLYKRRKTTLTKKKCTKRRERVHCKVCFLIFRSLTALSLHNTSHNKNMQQDLSKKVWNDTGKYNCNFCPRTFKEKRLLQGHLFHVHNSNLGNDKQNSTRCKVLKSDSHSPTKHIMRQTTLLEYMFSPEKSEYSEITNNLNNSNAYSETIVKQEIDLNDNGTDLSINTLPVNTSLQDEHEMPSKTTVRNQPFVQIHIHSTAMKVLLGIDESNSIDSSKNNSQNNQSSGEVNALESSNTLEELSSKELSTISCQSEPVRIGEKLQTVQIANKNGDLLNMCKKCSVTLIRCDSKPKTSSTLNTLSIQDREQNNCTPQKRRSQQLRNRNVTITRTLDSSKNSSSTNSTPKGLPKSSPSLKLTTPNIDVVNNLNAPLDNQQSSHQQIAPDAEKIMSSNKTNASSVKASSSQKKLDSTTIQNTQPTTMPKLKELRVCLVKLPQIKKELNESNIFHCEICQLPFHSERRKDKHIKKAHTTYISSICTARCKSKRCMLSHYLKEHCCRGYNRCCVCYKFFRSRLMLQRHLYMHCIKVVLPNSDTTGNNNLKCNPLPKTHRRTTSLQPNLITPKTIVDIEQENVNVNNVDNTVNQPDESKAINNADAKVTDCEQNECLVNETTTQETENLLENNVIYLSSNDYEEIELIREPTSDPLSIISNSLVSNNETRVAVASNPNTVPVTADNNKQLFVAPNVSDNINKRYPCSICGKQFQKLEGLWQHKRTYTQSSTHSCTTCGLCFSNRKILRNHINTTHDYYISSLCKYHCQFCNQGFRSEPNLRIHELHYHAAIETTGKQKIAELLRIARFENLNNSKTTCNVCGRNFDSYERYRLHCMYYHKGHVFACHFCNQIFQGLYMLHHHNKLYHYPDSTKLSYTYHCPICYEGFTIETHFQGHMAHVHSDKQDASSNSKSTSAKKSYVCSKCHLEFSTIMELMVHVEHYTDGGNYQCKQCPRKCCTLAVLNEHVTLNHTDRLGHNYKCVVCNEVLISSTSLLCHSKHIHQYTENAAEFTFDRKNLDSKLVCANTSMPQVISYGKCNISCPICGINFGTELYLKQHLAEYLDVGDYKCTTCERRFANDEFLKKHKANHTKQGIPLTKYYCSVCSENFQSSIVYESHIAHLHARVVTGVSSSNV